MKPDQIAALAREYAEEMIKGKSSEELPNCLKNSMLELNTEYVAKIFQWLLRRYCLVEKEAINNAYQQAIEQGKHAHVKCHVESRAKKALLESLFPEIGKEVEDGLV